MLAVGVYGSSRFGVLYQLNIVSQIVEMFGNASNPPHTRSGGLIGLAATTVAPLDLHGTCIYEIDQVDLACNDSMIVVTHPTGDIRRLAWVLRSPPFRIP